jgi:hypothetical protein
MRGGRVNWVIKISMLILIGCWNEACNDSPANTSQDSAIRVNLTGNVWMYTHKIVGINFRDSVIVFTKELQTDSITTIYDRFTFGQDGALDYALYYPMGTGFCGNGMLSVNNSKWEVKDSTLELIVKGGYSMEGKFEYDIIYHVDSITDSRLVLTKQEEVSIDKTADN